MQLCRVSIERFNGIKKLDLSLENSLQLIAGPNNSCKSTILKAIHYFFICFENIPISDYEPQNSYYKLETRSTTKIRLHFNNLNESEMEIFRKNWLVRNKEIWIELRLDRRGEISFFASGNENPKAAYEALIDSYQVIYVPAVRAGTADLRATETRKLFVTARSVLSKKKRGKLSQLQKNFADAAKQVTNIMQSLLEESLSHVKESLPSEAEIKFKFPDSDEILGLLLGRTTISTRNGTNLTVDDEGTGFQSLLSLGLLKYIESIGGSQNLLFLVEEPEAFLHPQYQRAVSDYLKQLAKKSQVLISTHSSILVDSVELSHIARLIKNHNGLDYRWKWEPSELARLKYLSRYCDAKNSELIFAEKVILCEGITDKNIICEIYRQTHNSEHHHSNISVISGDGSAISHVAHIMKLFNIESIIVMDKDNYSGDRECLKKICNEKGVPLSNVDYRVLDEAKSTKCANFSEAAIVRDNVNHIFKARNIFLLGGDIESAVVHSYSKSRILENLGPDGLGHIKQDLIPELTELSGEQFINRINQLIGSKGWGTSKPIKENKPKPHVLQNFMANAGIRSFKANSDMSSLSEAISQFLRA